MFNEPNWLRFGEAATATKYFKKKSSTYKFKYLKLHIFFINWSVINLSWVIAGCKTDLLLTYLSLIVGILWFILDTHTHVCMCVLPVTVVNIKRYMGESAWNIYILALTIYAIHTTCSLLVSVCACTHFHI